MKASENPRTLTRSPARTVRPKQSLVSNDTSCKPVIPTIPSRSATEQDKFDGHSQDLAGQRLSPPREYLAQFATVKATRKLEAPNQKESIMETSTAITARQPWNKGKLVGQKTPLKLKEIWAIRIRLQIASRCRDLALFNLAVDSKLRACDLMQLRVRDVCHGQSMASRALILQQKTSRPVQFEITEPARTAVSAWISHSKLKAEDYLFPSRIHASPHLSTRQYARIVDSWVLQLGLDPSNYGTHTLRRTKATLIYRRTKNLRAVQLLLGHTKLESTARYLGIEVDDALEMAEQTEA